MGFLNIFVGLEPWSSQSQPPNELGLQAWTTTVQLLWQLLKSSNYQSCYLRMSEFPCRSCSMNSNDIIYISRQWHSDIKGEYSFFRHRNLNRPQNVGIPTARGVLPVQTCSYIELAWNSCRQRKSTLLSFLLFPDSCQAGIVWGLPFVWYFRVLASGPRWNQEKQRSVKNKNIFSVVNPTF
jgi:hypothetical protein